MARDMTTGNPQTSYEEWLADPTPERMAATVRALNPVLVSEIQRYPGPKNVLHGKAKELSVAAIRTYNPGSGAKLSSWVTTQLQPLNRYGRSVSGSVRVPEMARRQAAEMEAARMELLEDLGDDPTDEQLADRLGISTSRVSQLRNLVRPTLTEGQLEDMSSDVSDDSSAAPGVELPGGDSSMRDATDTVYGSLDDRDKQIFSMKTGYGGSPMLDNQTVAKRLGVSPALVSQRSLYIATRIREAHTRG